MRELRHMITLGSGPRSGGAADPWTPPVLKTVAARGEGITEVVDAVTAHQEWLARTGELDARRRARAASEIEAIAFGILRARIGDLRGDVRLDALAARVVGGDLDPYAAADTLVAGLAL
jgi:LAO/AO transport system kinase